MMPATVTTCFNCNGHIFIADLELLTHLRAFITWSHVEDNGCDDPVPMSLELAPLVNMNDIVGGNVDEAVEDTYFRLIIESPYFDDIEPPERELFLLTIAQNCIQWTLDRKDY